MILVRTAGVYNHTAVKSRLTDFGSSNEYLVHVYCIRVRVLYCTGTMHVDVSFRSDFSHYSSCTCTPESMPD